MTINTMCNKYLMSATDFTLYFSARLWLSRMASSRRAFQNAEYNKKRRKRYVKQFQEWFFIHILWMKCGVGRWRGRGFHNKMSSSELVECAVYHNLSVQVFGMDFFCDAQ